MRYKRLFSRISIRTAELQSMIDRTFLCPRSCCCSQPNQGLVWCGPCRESNPTYISAQEPAPCEHINGRRALSRRRRNYSFWRSCAPLPVHKPNGQQARYTITCHANSTQQCYVFFVKLSMLNVHFALPTHNQARSARICPMCASIQRNVLWPNRRLSDAPLKQHGWMQVVHIFFGTSMLAGGCTVSPNREPIEPCGCAVPSIQS